MKRHKKIYIVHEKEREAYFNEIYQTKHEI